MRNYVSIAVFGLAFGFATAVTLLLFASAASTLRGTTAATSAIHVASTPPNDAHVMVVNDDPWASWTDRSDWQDWHHHWHWRMGSLEARIRERVARKVEAAFAHMSDDFDIDVDVDNDDDDDSAPTPPTPPAAVVPTTPVITARTR